MPMPPRPIALMIPIVTVWRRPNGLPTACTMSPARAFSLSANVLAGRFFSSIFNKATSVPGSVPTFFALYLRSSVPSRARNDVISGENVSIRADDHARAEALKRLLTLPLRKLSAEKLSQRVIGKWKRRQRARHRLRSEHRDNTRCDLLNDRSEGCVNHRLHGRRF